MDVTLNKMMELVKAQVTANTSTSSDTALQLDERPHRRSVVDSNIEIVPRSRVLTRGRIISALVMAGLGELHYHSELTFTPVTLTASETTAPLDIAVLESFKEIVRAELECQVCYSLMVDPLTTTCGHTYCRKCVARVLDHSTLCPACRRPLLSMRPGVSTEPSNKRLSQITNGLLADELMARIIAIQEEEAMDEEGLVPLFPCTLAYPGMPTFLHVFEPRYRLMIRRCVENGSRTFGMMMYNGHRLPQGNLGRSQYMQYGTALHISRIEVFPDGRSLLETQGLYRFRVLEGSLVDGYHVARIQRIDDMPLAEEEAAEALETSGPEPDENNFEAKIKHMSTQALLQYSLDFIQQARTRSADWLHERVLAAYGQPPTDAANFPFWFASVLPINDDEKYKLLPTTSVRERLKMTARWIKILEEARWPLEPELEYGEAQPQSQPEVAPVATREPDAEAIETADLYQADADDPPTPEDEETPQSQAPAQQSPGNERSSN
ncbi:hypothetical protein LTR70_005186 [Exophiala xenobiotica]|uniref:Uncharacterized protein n=1 Tax=Lithohypha guttulata TaxID=1690604 RepID=A0ABR0KBJ5_9EURO|nr:hypothetical protein LTR24_004745 [Lithohypha guttulata]KAK5318890.1 hypothetical protein LTR70_005186 [Exophiala xenobiotica]